MNTFTRLRAVHDTARIITRVTASNTATLTATLCPHLANLASVLAGVARQGVTTARAALAEAWATGEVPAQLTAGGHAHD